MNKNKNNSSIIASNDIFGNNIFSGFKDYFVPWVPTEKNGGELIFIHRKTKKTLLHASTFGNVLFNFTCVTTTAGGVSDLKFKFSYFGRRVNLSETAVRIRVNHQSIGYADLSSYEFDNNNNLTGTGISLWHSIAKFKPDQTFYKENERLDIVINDFIDWASKMLNLEGFYFPINKVFYENIPESDKSIILPSIDTNEMAIIEILDRFAILLNASFDIKDNLLIFRRAVDRVKHNVFNVNIKRSLDTIVNKLDIYALDRKSETIELQLTLKDNESIATYGIRPDKIDFPFFINIDYNLFKDKMLTAQPLNIGNFSIILHEVIYFDNYIIPFYSKEVIFTLGNSLENWQGDIKLVEHVTNGNALKIEKQAVLTTKHAIDKITIVATGVFTIKLTSYDNNFIVYNFNSSGEAYKDLNVGFFIKAIAIEGNAEILSIVGYTSQPTYIKTKPTKITYNVEGSNILANCEASDNQTIVDILSDLNDNQRLQRAYLQQ